MLRSNGTTKPQRIRARLTKEGFTRYLSHLDYVRAVERAARRARLPLAYSGGFNPRARIVFASALALGATSEAEYVDFYLARRTDLRTFARALGAELPRGIRLVEVREVFPEGPSLASLIGAYCYVVNVRTSNRVYREDLENAIKALMESREILMERQGKKGQKVVDIRAYIKDLKARGFGDESLSLSMVLTTGASGETVRPEEVWKALERRMNWLPETLELEVHRTGFLPKTGPESR